MNVQSSVSLTPVTTGHREGVTYCEGVGQCEGRDGVRSPCRSIQHIYNTIKYKY